MKIVWSRQLGGRGDSPENPIVVPIALSLEVDYGDKRPSVPFHQRWGFKYINPHFSNASEFPWRAYGLDGGGHTPQIEVPILREEYGVGSIEISAWAEARGARIPDTYVSRVFFVRNRTEEEKKKAKLGRWITLRREWAKDENRTIITAGGKKLVENFVFLSLGREWYPDIFKKNMFGTFMSSLSYEATFELLDEIEQKFWTYVEKAEEGIDPEEEKDDKPTPEPDPVDPSPEPDPVPDPAPDPTVWSIEDIYKQAFYVGTQLDSLNSEVETLIKALEEHRG
jgi:hypothetical protein